MDLCRRLDGLPLAIELAAVRTRVLSVEHILGRLSDRFGLLTGGGRAALPRHQTLRTTINWSHDLLEPGERTLLRRLCVGPVLAQATESATAALSRTRFEAEVGAGSRYSRDAAVGQALSGLRH